VKKKGKQKRAGSVALRVLDVSAIRVDETYQRGVRGKVKSIVAHFDPHALGVLTVGERPDGSLWVVDGLQRLTALKRLDIKTVRCDVFPSGGAAQEAAVFALLNRNRCALHPLEVFNSELASGSAAAVELKRIAEAHGFIIPKRRVSGQRIAENQARELACVGTLLRAYKSIGADGVSAVVGVLARLWPGDPRRTQADILGGLWTWYSRRKGDADLARLVDRLNKTTPQRLLYTASQGIGGRDANVADTIERPYNSRAKQQGGSK